jgi:hypothetical protein
MKYSITRLGCAALVGAFLLPDGYAGSARAAPCIDTNSQSFLVRRTMTVQQPGGSEMKALGIDGDQQTKPTLIRLATLEPSIAAQMPMPIKTPLEPVSAEFSLSDITVQQGVIRYPNCAMADSGHEIAFTGTLTFNGGKLKVDGFFIDYAPPAGLGGPGDASGANQRG